jgi:hypothetical protein
VNERAKNAHFATLDMATLVARYAISAMFASAIYIVWLTVSITIGGWGTDRPNVLFEIASAAFFWFAGGFALALVLTIVPWSIAVWAHSKTQWNGRIYFPGVGAFLVFTLGCMTSSVSWKPLWIEDQTFLEGVLITAQRQGVCLIFCGITFGACYCWLKRNGT